MRPLRLRLKGFTAFREEQTIDFDRVEVFAIAGPTGSGKSSLLDAMTYALYGEVDRVGIQCSQLVSQGLPRMSVTLDFRVSNDDYRITRTTPSHGPSSVALERLADGEARSYGEGADRAREVKDLVKKIVGLDYDAFTRSVLLPQNKFAELLTGDPKKRREILIELLGLSLFNDMAKRAGLIARDARLQADDLMAVVAREYAGVDKDSLKAAKKAAGEAAERQAKIGKALEKVRAFSAQAEADRRAGADLSTCGDESAAMATDVDNATEALIKLAKFVATADARILKGEKEAKALAASHQAAIDGRTAAEKKWGKLAQLSEAKALADGLSRLRKAAQAADLARSRAEGRQPRSLKHQTDCDSALKAAVADAKSAAGQLKTAKATLQEAEHADQVAAVAAGLKKGDACPVCGQPLPTAPKAAGSGLRAAQAALKAAEAVYETAREVLAAAKLAKSEADKDVERLDTEIAQRREQADEDNAAVTAAERGIGRAFNGKVPENPAQELQGRIDELEKLKEAEDSARNEAHEAERTLADERQKRIGLDSEVTRERTRLEVKTEALYARCLKLGVAAAKLPKLASLPPVSKGIDPTVAIGRGIAAALSALARQLREDASSRAATEKALLVQAVKAADVVGSRAQTLDAFLIEVTVADRAALRAATEAKQKADDLAKRLKRREEMEVQIEVKSARARTFNSLGLELRADHIIAFLQGEALQAMAAAASVHLAQLSDDRLKLSASALSKQSPTEPIERVMPASRQRALKATEVYWVDSTVRRNTSIRRCADGTATRLGCGRDGKAADAVTGPAAGLAAGTSPTLLGRHRARALERGGGGDRGCGTRGRHPVVP